MKAQDVIDLRKKFNLTQKELADLVGKTQRTIANWENGSLIPISMQRLLETISSQDSIELHSQKRNSQPQDGIFVPNSVVEILLSQQRTIENLSQSVKSEYLINTKKSAV